jgi:phosphoesterase RecJ-like protein
MINDADFQRAIELINKSRRVLLTTHIRPDGDACGCIAAISETLSTLGKNVKILLLSELPAWYEFLFEQEPEIFSEKTKIDSDLIVIVDTDTYNQLPEFDKYLKHQKAEVRRQRSENRGQKSEVGSQIPPSSVIYPLSSVLVIDHHATSDNIGDVRLMDNSAAATALIVFDLLKYAGWPITKKIAEALFVAVSTDTGWFQFDNTDSRVLRVCAGLIDAGAHPSRMYRDLYQNFSPQRFKLMTAMLNTLELHLSGRFATQHLSQADFKRTGAKYGDTENLVDECRRISGVEATALFVELADGRVKVSLRSRGAIDVCKIAAKFGGGGHKMAAGVHLPGPIENAQNLIFNAVAEHFKQST